MIIEFVKFMKGLAPTMALFFLLWFGVELLNGGIHAVSEFLSEFGWLGLAALGVTVLFNVSTGR